MHYSIKTLNHPINLHGIKQEKLNLLQEDQGKIIGNTWQKYFSLNLNRTARTFGVYTDYDQNMNYSLIIGAETQKAEKTPAGLVTYTIPEGKYAVFTVKGTVPEAVQKFWADFWAHSKNFAFERAFTADFELYDERYFKAIPEVDVYISIK